MPFRFLYILILIPPFTSSFHLLSQESSESSIQELEAIQTNDAEEVVEKVPIISPDRLLLSIIEKQEALFSEYLANPPEVTEDAFTERVSALLSDYKEYVKKYKEDVLGHILFGKLLTEINQVDEAYAIFLKADSINPKIAVVKESLANYYAGKAMYQESIDYFFAALELKPRNARINFGLAKVLGKKGDVKQSQFYFKKAIRLIPDKGEYYFAYGEFLLANREDLILEGIFDRRTWDQELLASFYEASRLTPSNIYYSKKYAMSLMEVSSIEWEGVFAEWDGIEKRSNEQSEIQEARYFKSLALFRLKDFAKAKDLLDTIRLPSLWISKKELMDDIASNAPTLFSKPVPVPEIIPAVSPSTNDSISKSSLLNKELENELEKMFLARNEKAKEIGLLKKKLLDKDREFIDVQSDLTNLKKNNKLALEEFQKQKLHFEDVVQRYQTTNNALKKANSQIKELKIKLEEVEILTDKSNSLETKKDPSKKLINEKMRLLDELKAKNESLISIKNDKESLESNLNEVLTINKGLENQVNILNIQLEKALKDGHTEKSSFTKDLNQLGEEKKALIGEFKNKIKEFELTMSNKNSELNSFEKKLLDEKKSNYQLRSILKVAEQNLAELQKELKSEYVLKASLVKQRDQLASKLSLVEKKLSDINQFKEVIETQSSDQNMAKSFEKIQSQLDSSKNLNLQLVKDFEIQLSTARAEIDQKESDITILKKKLKDSQKSLELVQADWEKFRDRNSKLKKGYQIQASQFKDLSERYTSLQNDLKNQDLELSVLNEKLQKNQINAKKLAESKTLNKRLSDRLQRVEKDLISLSDKKDLSKIDRLETEKRDSEIILLKKRLKDSQKSLELVEADWQQLKDRNTKLQEGSKEQAEQYKALADRYTSAKDKLKNQDFEFSALNEKLQRNQFNGKELAESRTLNKSLADRLKRVEKDLISLSEKNDSSTSVLLQLKKRDSEIILLKKKLEDSQESLELVEADWQQFKNRNTKLQEGSKVQAEQYKALADRYTSARDKLKNQELELAALNEELQRGLIIVKELADSKSLNKSLSDRLERVEKDLVSIGGEGGQLSNARLAIEARDSEIVILKKNLKKAQESLELVKLNSAKFEDRYESLKDGYQDQSVQFKNLTDRYTNSQNELKVQESELTALRKRLQKSQIIEKDFAESKRLNKSLSARLEIVEKDLISIGSDYKSLQSKWSKTSRSDTKINDSKKRLIAETLEMIQSLNESIERPFSRMDRINKDMELLKSTNLDVSKVDDLLSEIQFLQSDLEFSKTAIDLFYDFLQEDSTL